MATSAAENAANTIAELKKLYGHNIPVEDIEEIRRICNDFNAISQTRGGQPFPGMPANMLNGIEKYFITAAWYWQRPEPITFAAVIVDFQRQSLMIVNEWDENWPAWLTSRLHSYTNAVIRAEGQNQPAQTRH